MDIEKHCTKCVYCVIDGNEKRCHRNPPLASPYGESFFPRVPQNFSYCGEFKVKEENKKVEESTENKINNKKAKTKKEKKQNELA